MVGLYQDLVGLYQDMVGLYQDMIVKILETLEKNFDPLGCQALIIRATLFGHHELRGGLQGVQEILVLFPRPQRALKGLAWSKSMYIDVFDKQYLVRDLALRPSQSV